MKKPTWWRDEYRNSPVLLACALAGLGAEDALHHLYVHERDMFKRYLKLAEIDTMPATIKIEG